MFPERVHERLAAVGTVTYNETGEQFTESDLAERLPGIDVCLTHWGSPSFTESALEAADDLQLVAHVGGSVAGIATDALYDHGVRVTSAVRVMAPFVAEHILTLTLDSLRAIREHDQSIRDGGWDRQTDRVDTLFGKQVGFVGVGSVGHALLDLLEPFGVTVRWYDPYLPDGALAEYDFAEEATLEEVLATSDVVSVHAAKTEETIHMLDAEQLARMPDGSLLVNAARGALVDEGALLAELESGRLSAALDVFEREPLAEESPLRQVAGAVRTPHIAGSPTRHRMAEAMVAEVERFSRGEPLQHSISRAKFQTMTKNWLSADDE
ncbi:hydroxyacid dehydrogenase [Haloarchaeobius sp. HME9146]|uniref:hydroxyacid dehydrogenase n=1 Tax=Haloarchaeobius sp. HME9146 TaxID=2978732 RepID=UPI0021BF0D2F|nr:hydroxyacid dehydrogenase [Haloarchaeobius sp. HME9146]MCT9098035.1 hydroxyacid dehydrogenase [Haloarchaeobius sp. HME9146]